MPYIPESKRKYWDPQFTLDDELTHPGTLNYMFTKLVQHFVKCRGGGWSDENLDSIYGALMCCLLELDRRKGKQPEKRLVRPDGAQSYTAYNDFVGFALREDIDRFKKSDFGSSLDINFAGLLRYYQKEIGPYEELKIKDNSDVYDENR